jgi:hypothetical protein
LLKPLENVVRVYIKTAAFDDIQGKSIYKLLTQELATGAEDKLFTSRECCETGGAAAAAGIRHRRRWKLELTRVVVS